MNILLIVLIISPLLHGQSILINYNSISDLTTINNPERGFYFNLKL